MFRFLIPFDGSPPARAALAEAARWASRYPAELLLVYIVQEVFQGADLVAPYNDALRAKGEQILHEASQPLQEAGFTVRTRCLAADPDDGLGLAIREERPDLIAMGTHARGSFERLFLGSLTEDMLSQTPCPMLVTRRGAGEPDARVDAPWSGAQRVLIGLDGSEEARRALGLLSKLVAPTGQITVLSVVDLPWVSGFDYLELARQGLEREVAQAFPEGSEVGVTIRVESGSAARTLVAVAQEMEADLLLLGTRGRGGLAQAVLGSVAREVVRLSDCPVLAVHGQSRLFS